MRISATNWPLCYALTHFLRLVCGNILLMKWGEMHDFPLVEALEENYLPAGRIYYDNTASFGEDRRRAFIRDQGCIDPGCSFLRNFRPTPYTTKENCNAKKAPFKEQISHSNFFRVSSLPFKILRSILARNHSWHFFTVYRCICIRQRCYTN